MNPKNTENTIFIQWCLCLLLVIMNMKYVFYLYLLFRWFCCYCVCVAVVVVGTLFLYIISTDCNYTVLNNFFQNVLYLCLTGWIYQCMPYMIIYIGMYGCGWVYVPRYQCQLLMSNMCNVFVLLKFEKKCMIQHLSCIRIYRYTKYTKYI